MVTLFQRGQLSRVNARHLLDDLASSYSHALDETVLVELVANALDAGAARIDFTIDQTKRRLSIRHNGHGMDAEEFVRYHDLAESRKERGAGIGFAGLGAKLAHSVASRVTTETRRGPHHSASEWRWKGDDLEWRYVRHRDLAGDGTVVSLDVTRKGSRLLDQGAIEAVLMVHYGPLLDADLANLYVWQSVYPLGVEFAIDGQVLPKRDLIQRQDATAVDHRDVKDTRGRRIGRAVFALMKQPLQEERQGIGVSTHGKLIRRDNLGLHPRSPDRITGWIEVPQLVECLTLSKQDFIDHGSLGEKYRRLRKAIQTAYADWLAKVGQNVTTQEARRAPRDLERELSEIIRRMPELRYLFGAPAKERAEMPSSGGDQQASLLEGLQLTGGSSEDGGAPPSGGEALPVFGPEEGQALEFATDGAVRTRSRTRKTRQGPSVQIVTDHDRSDMSWIEGDTIYVNAAHSSYVKAQRENQLRYHRRLVVLLALCREASVEPAMRIDLLTRALARWGQG